MIIPFTERGSDVNDVEWVTSDFIIELVTRCLYPKNQKLINERIYFVIQTISACDRYIDDNDDGSIILLFKPLFDAGENISMTRVLKDTKGEEGLLVLKPFPKRRLLDWVRDNEDLYFKLRPIHKIQKYFPCLLQDDVFNSGLRQMQLIVNFYEEIEW
jgi:hypothetical protein